MARASAVGGAQAIQAQLPRLGAGVPFGAGAAGLSGQRFEGFTVTRLSQSVSWEGNAFVGMLAAAGAVVGSGLVALYRRTSAATPEEEAPWATAAVAEASVGVNVGEGAVHLPPYAGKEPFRPDLFQPKGEVKTVPLTNIPYIQKRNLFFNRTYTKKDVAFTSIVVFMHAVAFIFGPMTYRPDCLALAFAIYIITGMCGITFSYHRQLSHKSFSTPKWLEYLMAYCGVQALEGHPEKWVSNHRYHHLYCETDRDPHTINEGFWWSHMGWLLDHTATEARCGDRSNAADIAADPFYDFIKKTYILHPILMACALYAWGGVPYLVWGMAVRIVFVWHVTWFVNSASHSWGYKQYKTSPPDESRNNWWVGILGFGEGWHNNHHAFQYSARHGLEWWQIDTTYYLIRVLQFLGLAWNVKLPSEAKKEAALL